MGATSSRFLIKNIESLMGLGVPESAILDCVPGGWPALNNPVLRFPREILVNIFHVAEQISDDPAIGFRCGLNHGHVTYNDIAFTILYCENLRESFSISARFEPLVQQIGFNSLIEDENVAQIIWETYEDDPEKLRHITDLSFATLARMGMWMKAVHGLSVKKMQVRHSQTNYHDQYLALFDCPIEYGAQKDIVTFDKAFLDVPLPGHNPQMLKLLVAKLERDLSLLGQTVSETESVRRYLEKIIGDEPPTIKHIAQLMNTQDWALRRKLKQEGTSFRRILETVRKERYELLEQQNIHTQVQIAGLLGYSEQSAFSRAYKKWYGAAPVRPRKR